MNNNNNDNDNDNGQNDIQLSEYKENIEDITVDINRYNTMDYYLTDTISIKKDNIFTFNPLSSPQSILPQSPLSMIQSSPSNKRNKKRKQKRKKNKKRGQCCDYISYDPPSDQRAQGNIQISKSLTEVIIPNAIKEKIKNVYTFMDKSVVLSRIQSMNESKDESKDNCASLQQYHHHQKKHYHQIPERKIFNFDFHDRETGQILFCVVESQDIMTNKSRGYKWKMLNQLFTSHQIKDKFGIYGHNLPISWRTSQRFQTELNYGKEIKKILSNPKQRQEIINKQPWHKIDVFNRINNKRRMTLSLTKPEFIIQLTDFNNNYYNNNNNNNNNNDIQLIPILMFNNQGKTFWIEHIWIVTIDKGINIAISFKSIIDEKEGYVQIGGIHLDKEYLQCQHELINPNHGLNCKCFDNFQSHISDLKIGNPDDLQVCLIYNVRFESIYLLVVIDLTLQKKIKKNK